MAGVGAVAMWNACSYDGGSGGVIVCWAFGGAYGAGVGAGGGGGAL